MAPAVDRVGRWICAAGTCRKRRGCYDGGMKPSSAGLTGSITLPMARLCVGITGHRYSNPVFGRNHAAVDAALGSLCDIIGTVVARQGDAIAPTRLHSLLAHGADLMSVEQALLRNWDIVAPLPFGLALNAAINAHPETAEDALAIIAGESPDCAEAGARAEHIRALAARALCFELAEQDEAITHRYIESLRSPDDPTAASAFATLCSERVAAAGRIMIEQSDVLIAVWDGITPGAVGGTRHTIAAALAHGAPVIWIDARNPERWSILRTPESLHAEGSAQSAEEIAALIESVVQPSSTDQSERAKRFHTEHWQTRSHRRFHAYRRIEAVFGGGSLRRALASLVQRYERPEAIAKGSGAPLLATARGLPGSDQAFVDKIEAQVLQRFAWADGLSTYLSDAYRGGMVTNFLLSAFAIIGGVSYLPFASPDSKWPFALFEFLLLVAILGITSVGRKRRWHGRWFETRRVAEYFRHAPILLLLGVARSPGRWPRGSDTQWPEHYARLALRELGLPRIVVTQAYLRPAFEDLLCHHATLQQAYHSGKSKRLTTVHHKLDRLSEILFSLAVAAVATYLGLVAGSALGLIPATTAHNVSKSFTFLGVALPALGGAFAGIRYFGDFERFAAISDVTAEKLEAVEQRIKDLAKVADGHIRYAQVADLAHAIDDIVVAEIENWQSVFAGKQIAVPV